MRNLAKMGKWAVLGMIAVVVLSASCSAPAKPSQEEVKEARSADPYTRGIDKSRSVAGAANERRQEEAL